MNEFQQTVFAIGAEVYNRVNMGGYEEMAETSDNPDIPDSPEIPEDSEASKEAFAPQFNFDFEEDHTVQADYEAID